MNPSRDKTFSPADTSPNAYEHIRWLEDENARLRRRLTDLGIVERPDFNPVAFHRALRSYLMWMMVPMTIAVAAPLLRIANLVNPPAYRIAGVPLIDMGGASGIPGVGIGIIAMGGASVGVVAIGGLACGLVAYGGCSIGVIAVGGSSIGLIAFGGGAIGYYAAGGGAIGIYALGAQGRGRYVFSLKRQDREAVEFWTRWMPRLSNAFTHPLPVIPVDDGGMPSTSQTRTPESAVARPKNLDLQGPSPQ